MACPVRSALQRTCTPVHPYQTSKIETPREQLLISRSLETDKDVQQADGDVSQTFLLVVSDQIECEVLDKPETAEQNRAMPQA